MTITMDLILSFTAVLISVISLASTLRKKEFGEFLNIQTEKVSEVWISVVKSNLYDVQFEFIEKNKPSRISILKLNETKESTLWFDSSIFRDLKIAIAEEYSIIKFTRPDGMKVKIIFKDRYNNIYCQLLDDSKITQRKHLNPLNFSLGGNS